jgi:uncharacterized protein
MLTSNMIDQDLTALWTFCVRNFQLRSVCHGPVHWEQVQTFGLAIARENGANRDFVRLFAVLHDSCRENEGTDPEHGLRAANRARELRGKLFCLDDVMFEKLVICCTNHDKGRTSTDLEIGTCWDADRLDLPRVCITPDERYLSTEVAKRMRRGPSGSR